MILFSSVLPLCLIVIWSCECHVFGCAFFLYKVVSCGPRCGDWNAIPAKRRRAGERSSTAGSRGPGRETPHHEDDAGEVRSFGEMRWRSEASHRRLPGPHRADAAERDTYCWRKTLERRRAGGGASQAQCRRGAHRRQHREVPAAVASHAQLAIVEASGVVPSTPAVEMDVDTGKRATRR